MADESGGFSIGELSRRTGVPVATLRTWEVRYGQPRARRLPSGHRRYDDDAVRAVGQMLGQRAAGAEPRRGRLPARRGRHPGPVGLRDPARPAPRAAGAAADQAHAARGHARDGGRVPRGRRAGRAVRRLPAGAYVAQSWSRWRDLGRASEFAAVLADFGDGPAVTDDVVVPGAVGRPVPRSPGSGCWSATARRTPRASWVGSRRDRPGVTEAARRFETVWTLDPQIVRSAARICAAHVSPHLPDGGAALEARLSGIPVPGVRGPRPGDPGLPAARRLPGRPDVLNLDQWRTPRQRRCDWPVTGES